MKLQLLPSLRHGGQLEESLWNAGENGACLWSCSPSISVPMSFRSLENLDSAASASEARGWPVEVRRTGGGIVPQGPGVINFGLMQHDSKSTIHEAFASFSEQLVACFAQVGLHAEHETPGGAWCPGAYDLSVNGRKLAGISQRRHLAGGRSRTFIHAAILVSPDLDASFQALCQFNQEVGGRDTILRDSATSVMESQAFGNAGSEAGFANALVEAFGLLPDSNLWPGAPNCEWKP